MRDQPAKKVYLREYRKGQVLLVVICDQNTLGKTFKEGRYILDVTRRFYGGELVELSYAVARISKATIVNLVGNDIVSAAVEADLIHPDAIRRIQGIAHAQRMIV
ncbi:MAG: DUF424 domain-containing protein [Candidatus Ranarchaeia archaeon]